MTKQRIETGKAPHIIISSCNGDLSVKGWPEAALVARGNFDLKETKGVYKISSKDDLLLQIPIGSILQVEEVTGDLAVKEQNNDVSIGNVHGDTILSVVGGGKIGTVNGDLSAMHLSGPLSLETVNGDVSVRYAGDVNIGVVNGDLATHHINGSATINEVNGDASLRSISGDVTVGHIGRDVNMSLIGGLVSAENIAGDGRLRGALNDGVHRIVAKGDIVIRWPEKAPFNLVASSSDIVNRLPFEDVEETKGEFTGHIGASKTNLELEAGGTIVLKDAELIDEKWEGFGRSEYDYDLDLDLSNLGNVISAQVNAHVARMTSQIEDKFGADFGQKIAEKIARKTEKAAARAERAAQRAQQRAERMPRQPRPPKRPTAPHTPGPTVSAEEQMKILRMVENGAISPEEASMLLEAMEG